MDLMSYIMALQNQQKQFQPQAPPPLDPGMMMPESQPGNAMVAPAPALTGPSHASAFDNISSLARGESPNEGSKIGKLMKLFSMFAGG